MWGEQGWDQQQVHDFWGGNNDYREMMGSVGSLPEQDQMRYDSLAGRNGRRQSTVAGTDLHEHNPFLQQPAIAPAEENDRDLSWWNQMDDRPATRSRPAGKTGRRGRGKRAAQKKSKISQSQKPATRTPDSDEEEDSDSVVYEVPLVNLEAKSPVIWTGGVALIMAICIVCEIVQTQTFESFKDNPMYGVDDSTLLQMGAKYGPLILDGDWWRLFSAIFTQAGLISFALTAVGLWFCRVIERDSGFWRACIMFMLAGVYGYIVSCLFTPFALTCGGTGAVFGYLGMMLCDLIASWRGVQRPVFRLVLLIVVMIVFIIIGLGPYVDQWAHLGGLVMGLLCAVMLLPNLNFGKLERLCHGIVAFFAFPIMSTLFMICLVILFRRIDSSQDWCPGCYKINCVCIANWCNKSEYLTTY